MTGEDGGGGGREEERNRRRRGGGGEGGRSLKRFILISLQNFELFVCFRGLTTKSSDNPKSNL